MMDFSRAKLYLFFAGVILLIAGVVALYTYLENYFDERKANRRKVIFRKENGKMKGYWKNKDGEKYDKDLKIDD